MLVGSHLGHATCWSDVTFGRVSSLVECPLCTAANTAPLAQQRQRQMQNTGKSQEVVTATVLAAFEILNKGKDEYAHPPQ